MLRSREEDRTLIPELKVLMGECMYTQGKKSPGQIISVVKIEYFVICS